MYQAMIREDRPPPIVIQPLLLPIDVPVRGTVHQQRQLCPSCAQCLLSQTRLHPSREFSRGLPGMAPHIEEGAKPRAGDD
jgi:hypothetical protein